MGLTIFISYSKKDTERFQIPEVAKRLNSYSSIDKVLIFEEDSKGDFVDYMSTYISSCNAFLLFCSKNSIESPYVNDEWHVAYKKQKVIIPIFKDTKYIPDMLSTKVGVKFDIENFNKTIDTIFAHISENTENDTSLIPPEQETVSFKGKTVNKEDFKILRELQEEIDNIVDDFKVDINNNIISIDLSSLYLEEAPKSISLFPHLREVNFNDYSFDVDEPIQKLVYKGISVKIDGKPYEQGQIEVRNKRKKHLDAIISENNKTINEAKDAYWEGNFEIANKLFDESKKICAIQGWSSGVEYAKRIKSKAKEEMKKKKEFFEKGLRAKKEVMKDLPPDEAEILQNLEKILNKQFALVQNPEDTYNMSFCVEENNITALNLYKCGLLYLPEEIFNLKSLKYLNLGRDRIKEIPSSIENLTLLEVLKLKYNKIEELPEAIGHLTSLKILDLNNNNLKSIPKEIGELESLEYFNLYSNKVAKIPESLGNLSSIKELYLNFNKITKLPDTMGNLSSLEKLYVNYNNLFELPESICKLYSLEYLNISHNFLTEEELPECIGALLLPRLKTLVIYGNFFDIEWSKVYLEERGVKVYK